MLIQHRLPKRIIIISNANLATEKYTYDLFPLCFLTFFCSSSEFCPPMREKTLMCPSNDAVATAAGLRGHQRASKVH